MRRSEPARSALENIREMSRVVHSKYTGVTVRNLQLAQGTRVLGQPPIGRGRLIKDLQQYRPIHTVMPHENDCFVMMMFQNKTDGVCCAGAQIL